ncbi:hypothetical protein AwDysgo_21880 [Bacteroidales bacterium]|nr:hypothetical protein AwDysgo_21880 [Bacteroidales bacterium]
MKQLLLITCLTLLGICQHRAVYGQNTELEGTWVLIKVELNTVSKNGDTTSVAYAKGKYANTTSCIYRSLSFNNDQCSIIGDDNIKSDIDFKLKNNILSLWFTAPIEFEYEIMPNGDLRLSRKHNEYNSVLSESLIFISNLIYTRK